MKRFRWHQLRTLFARHPAFDGEPVSDGELLERFAGGDSAAFELLVCRHAEAVFGTCGRICRDEHDAEDALQAVFFVLARKAGGIRRSRCLAGWLHRVAHRAATRAAMKRSVYRRREIGFDAELAVISADPDDLRMVLDAEINRLADRYRLPILLCYLQGLSTNDAARQLGIPQGTVLSRLSTARRKLTARLTQRGITVPATAAGLFGFGTGPTASAALLAAASRGTILSSTATSAGLLAREILQMTAFKTSTAWATAFVAVAGIGGTVLAIAANGEGPPVVAKAPPEKAKPEPPVKNDDRNLKDPDDREKLMQEREKERQILRKHQIARLEEFVNELEVQSRLHRDRYLKMGFVGHPEYDTKVLTDAIAKIDAQRLAIEDNDTIGKENMAKQLEKLRPRRELLVQRLLKEEQAQSDRAFQLESIKREMARTERIAGEFRERLEHMRLGTGVLGDKPATDPALQKLIDEVAELRNEVRKLSEAKK